MRAKPCPRRHSREGGNPVRRSIWIPAFAGMTLAGLAVPAIMSAPLSAQTPAANITLPFAPIDPDRLEAARELINVIMPPDRRDAMVLGMIEPSMRASQQALLESPQIAEIFVNNPTAQAQFAQMIAGQLEQSRALMLANLPALIEAMSLAYARRFSERELDDIATFYRSRSGQAYLDGAAAVMADPAVIAWQRGVMGQVLEQSQRRMAEFSAQLGATQGDGAAVPQQRGTVNGYLDAMRGGGASPCVSGDADCGDHSPAEDDQ